ncbi:hypothetical protein OPV22_002066 [Ensete ventricosum]|uniref:Uncharacterized protein n=2 Tax=Ensete ventricosum TaxID=4639 RepID=A0A444CCN4_ENSVE|nr:hypothetical protein OPV22_002066 [Ensete ventricosum]RWV83612.1 hypothetical protein GW17_00054752 [Ensete ventricosum]RWW86155.1 hypothetical protein BHE74_00005081 [Ensete ventricosum]RZR70479.1 hypothetical protein BHM03_00000088 [Ensete ventricosum]
MAKNTRPRYARSHAGCTSPQWSTARCGFVLALALPATATTATAGAATTGERLSPDQVAHRRRGLVNERQESHSPKESA